MCLSGILSSPISSDHPSDLPSFHVRSLQHLAHMGEEGVMAALHSSDLDENNSTGCPALQSKHRRSADVIHPGTHSLTQNTHSHTNTHTDACVRSLLHVYVSSLGPSGTISQIFYYALPVVSENKGMEFKPMDFEPMFSAGKKQKNKVQTECRPALAWHRTAIP